jgi:long-chain fatty acid transport protein
MQKRHLTRAVAIALLGLSGAASAITNVESNASIPFNFSNPGARSLAMGGAFVGLADDATAAYTNPAGLTGLGLEQQFGIELRRTENSNEYASSGSVSLNPFDTRGINYGDATSQQNNVSFLSWVLPRENWAIALYRHQMLDYDASYTSGAVTIGNQFETFPIVANTDLSIVSYGASFAYDLTDSLSLGAGISWHDFEIGTSTARYDSDFGAVNSPSALVSVQSQDGEDDDLSYTLGMIYRGSDNFSIGVSYHSAPEFDYQARNRAGAAFQANAFAPGVFTGQLLADQTVGFDAPDMLAIGFSWRPTDKLTVNLDVNKINYSNLSDGIISPFANEPGNPLTVTTQVPFVFGGVLIPAGTQLNNIVTSAGERIAASLVTVDDVFEPHLGFEYAMLEMERPVFLRFGMWLEPSHTLRFERDPESVGSDANRDSPDNPRNSSLLNATIFSTGSDEIHFSGGVGMAFESFQVDFAVDVSDRQDVFSFSGVWRF